MKLYFSVIGIAMWITAAVNIACRTAAWPTVILLVLACTAAQFALDGLLALLVSRLPDSRFGPEAPRYAVTEREKKLYKKLKVRRWKDKVWELGGLGGFSKKRLLEPGSPAYIRRFIIECNKGVLTHRLSYFVGFLPMALIPDVCAFTVACPIGAVNLALNILPTLVLRYNTPKLQAMLRRLEKAGAAPAAL